MLSLETLQDLDGSHNTLFRFVRMDNELITQPYPEDVYYEDITYHGDLLSDDFRAEIAIQRISEQTRYDAGSIDVQPFGDRNILVYSHSADLRLPVTSDARYATSLLINRRIGRPWRVRAVVNDLYENNGNFFVPRK